MPDVLAGVWYNYDYTTPGDYTLTVPLGAGPVNAIVIGGGAAGYRDCTNDDRGGGGGGGGYAEATRTLVEGTIIDIRVGAGGQIPGCNSRPSSANGGTSKAVSRTGDLSARATGGQTGTDNSGGGGGGGGSSGDIVNSGGDGDDDDTGREGGGAGNRNGNSGYCGNGNGGRGTELDGTRTPSCQADNVRRGQNYGGGGAGNHFGGLPGRGGDGAVRVRWQYYIPEITTFSVTNATSSGGTPSDEVTLSWSTKYADSVSIDSGVGSVTPVSAGSKLVNTGQQSVYPSNSPRTKTYTLTASGPGGSVTATATASTYNDNTTSNSWNTSFSNLEPSTSHTAFLGTIDGVDMPTSISVSGSGNFISKSLSGGFASSLLFNAGDNLYLKSTSLPFNTDLSGLASDAEFGKTNSKSITITNPGGNFVVTYTTKAPKIREDFNYFDNLSNYPYEDIDLISNAPTEFLLTASVSADDIEIPMEIKLDNPDAQISINGGTWQNTRST